jgi:hypothetical protein
VSNHCFVVSICHLEIHRMDPWSRGKKPKSNNLGSVAPMTLTSHKIMTKLNSTEKRNQRHHDNLSFRNHMK